MKYLVRWLPAAEEELAALWLNSLKRSSVTHAAHQLDLQLQDSPAELGESRPGGLRIHFAPPLGTLFRSRQKFKLWRLSTSGNSKLSQTVDDCV
jgi:hypothetical protein